MNLADSDLMHKRKRKRKKKGMSARRIKCAWRSAKRRGKKKLDKKAFKNC